MIEKFIKDLNIILKEENEDGYKLDKLIGLIEDNKPMMPLILYVDLINVINLDAEKYTDNDIIYILKNRINNYLDSLKI